MSEPIKLKKTLGPLMLWGLGVGYVISGMYFGWNLGLPAGGTYGLAIAGLLITIMYVTFVFSYTELATTIPRAGGAFDYATIGLGRDVGFLGGMAQLIEFLFAPPAIAFAIGAYFQNFFPEAPVLPIAIVAYFAFTILNIAGVKTAATFELIITILAVAELLIFAGLTLPHFKMENLTVNPAPAGNIGIIAAIPFAIWFFLAIEGVANVAEEAKNPSRDVLIGFGSAIGTLVILAFLTFISAVGVGGWEAIVYPNPADTATVSDSPLPLALKHITGDDALLFHMLITIGLFGLIASFHGIILAAGRATFEFGRVKYFPGALGKVQKKFQTPANALIFNMFVGIAALFTGKTGDIITISVFGALLLYIISMLSLFALRKKHPKIPRPFKVPMYPVFPAIALIIATVSFVALCFYYPIHALIFGALMGAGYAYFFFFVRARAEHHVHLHETLQTAD